MPRLRARMAAWLVAPPAWVTMPITSRLPSMTTCEGSSSSATMISGPGIAPVCGRNTSVRWLLKRITTSRTSASRSLMYSSLVRENNNVYSFSNRSSAAAAVARSSTMLERIFGGERRIEQDRFVGAKNGRLVGTDLSGHFLEQGMQIGDRLIARRVVAGQFAQNLVFFQAL